MFPKLITKNFDPDHFDDLLFSTEAMLVLFVVGSRIMSDRPERRKTVQAFSCGFTVNTKSSGFS
uniref:Uncharacterized protein n=1 Tax=Physcomitrium patens TaxID=3218 RepID=A0A2K1IFV8_PHYPA|nr:hypothetical protein PHYPA_028750 [Physcomitrium patens]